MEKLKKFIKELEWDDAVIAIMFIINIILIVIPTFYFFTHQVTRLELFMHFKWMYLICLCIQVFLFFILKRFNKI
ncbi:MAG: hypothetical protein WC979_01110 [Candidatus Pacearchaeota archaeon]